MKNLLNKVVLFVAVAAATCLCLRAEDPYEEIGGIKWYYSVTNGEAIVTSIWSSRDGDSPNGDLVVPGTLGDAPVTRIERYVICPYGNSGLGSVTFPDSLRTMDEGNFMRCSALTNVVFGTGLESFDSCFSECWNISAFVVPEGNPNFLAEGPVLYSKNKKTLVKCGLEVEDFEVPSFVTAIGAAAFNRMYALKSVTFPSGLLEIGDQAFNMCKNLESVSLPNGLQVLGYSAFYGCEKVASVTIPATVARIGDYAFGRNISLVSLTIENGVKDIGDLAFNNCDALAAVSIPNSVTNIGGSAFLYCTNLCDVTIGSGVVKIGKGAGEPWVDEWGVTNWDDASPAFGGCDSLINFKLASGNKVFEEIGGCLFLRDTPKTAKTLAVYPSGREDLYFTGDVNVTKIGEVACAQCNKFTTLDITNSVREIGAQGFTSCWLLSKVVVNPGVTNIAYGAFMLNMELADVEIAGTVKKIGQWAFMHCYMPTPEVVGRMVLHEGIEELGPFMIERTRDLYELVVPDSVTKIGEGALSDSQNLRRLTLGSGVTELPYYLCCSDYALTSVTIRGKVKSIGESAFMYCEELQDINLPDSVEFIGEDAFWNCYKLPYVSISASTVGRGAFYECHSLARVDFSDALRSIGTNAFYDCYSLRDVVLPAGVETVDAWAFRSCGIEKAYLPKSLESVVDTTTVMSIFYQCPLGDEDIIYYEGEGPAFVTVTFMSQGEVVDTRQYLANVLDYLPSVSASGLAFLGWYNAEEGGAPASDADITGESVTLYARWIISPFVDSQGWGPAEDEALPDASVWRADVSRSGEAFASCEVVGPASLSFYWKRSDDAYDDDFTVAVDGQVVDYSYNVEWQKMTVDVTEPGSHLVTWRYTRGQWSYDPEVGNAYLADIRITPGAAKTITFDPAGGTLPEGEASRKVVSELGELPMADKDGVAFAGWWTDRDGGERVTAATKPEADATYYAHWVELPFTVSGSGKFWIAEDGSWATLRFGGSSVTASVRLTGPCMVMFDWRHVADRWSTSLFRVDGETWKWRDEDKGWETVNWSADDTAEHVLEWEFSGGWSSDPGEMRLKNISMGTPYDITFDPNDDYSPMVEKRAGKLGTLPVPYRFDYVTFDGWYTAPEGGERVTGETPVTGPATYYGRWVESPVVTYWGDLWLFEPDGSLVSDNTCNEYNPSVAEKELRGAPGTLMFRWRMQSDSGNGTFAFLTNPDDDNPDFVVTNSLTKTSDGWVTERYVFTEDINVRWSYSVGEKRGGIERGWIKDVTWTPGVVDTVEWKVTFNANGGELEGDAAKVVDDNFPVGKVPSAAKADHLFLGWFTEAEGGVEVTRETIVTTNLYLYAHWQYVEPTPPEPPEPPAAKVWTVTFDANGGELVGESTRSVTNECAVGTLPVATKADSSLIGWFTEAEGGEAVTAATIATSDMTVYAHWTFDGLVINTDRSYTTEDDGSFTLVLPIMSGSKPTVKVTGLPSGITFTANTLTISGKAKAPGISSVTVSATNAKVKTPVTQAFNLVVPNFKSDLFTTAGLLDKYDLAAGAAPDLAAAIAKIKGGEWKLAVAGLPAGLKYDDKNNAITGVATKEGTFTVTFTATKGSGKTAEKEVATATFKVEFRTLTLNVGYEIDPTATNKVKVTGGGKYPVGAKVSLKATPDKGNVFAGWYDAEGKPLVGAADYRTASYSYVATSVDTTLTAMFATEAEDIASLKVTLSDAKTDDDGTYELDLGACVESASLPKLAVKGLPTGLKFDAKTLKITGAATKPGVYKVKVEATNTSVKKATDASTGEFELKVPNFTTDTFKAAGLDTDGKYVLAAGVLPGDVTNVVNAVVAWGWTLKIDGLPAGVKFDAKKNVFTGVATKEGFFTVTFTATKGSGKTAEKEVATATFEVAYPTLTLEIAAYDDETATNKCKVAGGGKYAAGAKVTLKATPDKGKVFAGWFDAEGNPLAGAADYRTASFPYVATDADVTLTAKFATEAEDIASLKVMLTNATTAADGAYELDLADTNLVSSITVPKLSVKGLPTGLKFDAKTLKIAGKASKPGVYKVKVEATNTSVKKATSDSTGEFELTVPNKVSAALPNLKSATDAYGTNFAGVAFDPALVDCTPAEGWTVKVAGLPTGLKYDAKTGKITGVSTAKAGSYTVTFTATQGKSKEEATITLNVADLPNWAVGTFDGATDDGYGLVSATVAANGKVTTKVLVDGATLSLSAASFDSVELPKSEAESPVFLATVVGKVGKALVTNEVEITSVVVDGVTVGVASGVEVSETPVTWTAWQNLWKRADTKADMPLFKKDIKVDHELGEEGDEDNKLTLTFKKDGVVSFAGKVGGTKVSGSSQLVNDGTGWSVTLYAPPKAPFDGWSKTFDVTLTIGEKNVVEDVAVATPTVEPPPAWGVGEYIGYGQVDYLPATLGGSSETLWGLVYMDMNDDFSFTGRFVPVSGPGSPAQFTGKMYRIPGMSGYLADDVEININGANALLHFQFITMGFGKMSGQSTQSSSNVTGISFWDVIHNIWARDDFPEVRPAFASGATKSIDLKDYPGLYDQAGKEYADTPGDALTFVFGEDGKVAVTGQIFGVAVNSTATLGVEMQFEEEAKLECIAYFGANGRIYSLTCEIPSSGTVTSDDIVLSGVGLINGW